jgi:allantoinase
LKDFDKERAMLDLRIVNGELASAEDVSACDIGIRNGKIAVVATPGQIPDAAETIDATGKVIIPGAIDTHCHSIDPGPSDETGFDICSQSAAAGGVTTIVDMPFQLPATFNPETLQMKLDSISPKAYVDFALWGTALAIDLNTIPSLADSGIVGYKFFMQSSVEVLPHLHDGLLMEALELVKETGLPAGVHAENNEMIAHMEGNLRSKGRTDGMAFVESHPPVTELEAMHRALFFAERVGLRFHIFHCTLPEGVDMVAASRAAGHQITVETCSHYLVLDEKELERQGGFAKIAPPMRTRRDIDGLWERIAAGEVDNVASDHCPFFKKQKQLDDIWDVPAGAPGIQTLVPLLLSQGVNQKRITLPQLVRVIAEGPARLCGLYPRKGACKAGSDADLIIVDLNRERPIADDVLIGADWTPFTGITACFPERTLVRGKTVFAHGQISGERGYGEFIKRL